LIAGIAIGAFVLVAGFAAWSRFAPHRAERHSVTTHQRALDVLGTASRRWEGVAPVHAPKPEDVARAHVQTLGDPPNARRLGDGEPVSTRRSGVRLVPPSGSRPVRLPIFVDEGVVASDSPGEPDAGERDGKTVGASDGATRPGGRAAPYDHEALSPISEVATRASRSRRHRYHGGRPARRATSAAASAVALAAIGVATWQLTSGAPAPTHHATTPPATTGKSKGRTHTGTGRQTGGQGLVPTSVSPSVVAYAITGGAYTITFSASGPCWLGVQQGVNGKYLWQTTLLAGQTSSYKANGPVAVRLGAPPYVKVQVNGVNVELPPTNVQPYDITFSSSRRSAA
jgi:hypothetical protein